MLEGAGSVQNAAKEVFRYGGMGVRMRMMVRKGKRKLLLRRIQGGVKKFCGMKGLEVMWKMRI